MRRGENAMLSRHFAAILLAGSALAAFHGTSRADSGVALTGAVASAAEGPMAGVTVTATPVGPTSSISVTVTTDDHGRYSFPAGRLAPGTYALATRAVGYDLDGEVTATVAASAPAVADLKLTKTRNLASQLTSAEWLASWPGTDAEKRLVADCMSCHTLERIARSSHTVDEWVLTIPRMLRYAQNTTPLAPQMRTGESTGLLVQQPDRLKRLAAYLASVNLSDRETFPYPLKTLKRLSGRSSRAIITTYKLPKQTDQPHDVMGDPDGGIYFTYFGDPALGRLDPKTGDVASYPIPVLKENSARGALSLYHDHDGNFWVSLMYQAAGAKFDKATKTFTMLPVAPEFNRQSSQQAFVAPQSAYVDGKVWIQDLPPPRSTAPTSGPASSRTFGPMRTSARIRRSTAARTRSTRSSRTRRTTSTSPISAIARSAASMRRPANIPSSRPRPTARARAAARWTPRAACGSPSMPWTTLRCSTPEPTTSENGRCRPRGRCLIRPKSTGTAICGRAAWPQTASRGSTPGPARWWSISSR
jgi:hypothetical protein